MITLYHHNLKQVITEDTKSLLLEKNVWIDVISPSKEDEALLEQTLKLDIPTKAEMEAIEPSSRLYKENDHTYITVTMVAKSESLDPLSDAVSFILNNQFLITVRYIETHSFSLFASRLKRAKQEDFQPSSLLASLFEATIDRLAENLEHLSHHLDDISQTILKPAETPDKPNYSEILQNIGRSGNLGAKIRESLVSFNRAVSYLDQSNGASINQELHQRLITVSKDITALSDHASFMSNKMTFLLDATLGMVNIEQNNIIKIFSVAAVIFLPPTLIASIYGMNFHFMPELDWRIGYPLAIAMMLLSAWLPFRYFKKKKWL